MDLYLLLQEKVKVHVQLSLKQLDFMVTLKVIRKIIEDLTKLKMIEKIMIVLKFSVQKLQKLVF